MRNYHQMGRTTIIVDLDEFNVMDQIISCSDYLNIMKERDHQLLIVEMIN